MNYILIRKLTVVPYMLQMDEKNKNGEHKPVPTPRNATLREIIQAQKSNKIIDKKVKAIAKPYTLYPTKSSKRGVFFIHGYASTAQVFKKYAIRLQHLGYTVNAALIAGHGTSPEHFARTTSKEMYLSVRAQFLEFQKQVDEIIIVGHSLGALIAVLLASKFKVHSLILLSYPVKPKSKMMYNLRYIIPVLSKFIPFWPVPKEKIKIIKKRGAVVYNKHPFRGLLAVLQLLENSNKKLSFIDCPLLLIMGTDDEFVDYTATKMIKQKVKSKKIEEWAAPHASHALIDTTQVDLLEEKILSFLAKTSPPN